MQVHPGRREDVSVVVVVARGHQAGKADQGGHGHDVEAL